MVPSKIPLFKFSIFDFAHVLAEFEGMPLGLRQPVPGVAYRWTREFEHATVTVDLNDPV